MRKKQNEQKAGGMEEITGFFFTGEMIDSVNRGIIFFDKEWQAVWIQWNPKTHKTYIYIHAFLRVAYVTANLCNKVSENIYYAYIERGTEGIIKPGAWFRKY